MGAETESTAAEVGGIETGPRAGAGGCAVGADEPAIHHGLAGKRGGLAMLENDGAAPREADPDFGGSFTEERVQGGAAKAEAGTGGEVGGDAGAIRGEGDAGEGDAFAFNRNAEGSEGNERVGEKAFAAGLVDGGADGVREEDVGAAQAEGDGGGEARGSSAGDENVTVVVTHDRRSALGVQRSESPSPQRKELRSDTSQGLLQKRRSPFEEEYFGAEAGTHGG